VDGDLHVELVGDLEGLVDDGVRGSPVLMDLEADRAGARLCAGVFFSRRRVSDMKQRAD